MEKETQKPTSNPMKVITPPFRVSFPALFKARSYEDSDPYYSVEMLFDKTTDLKAMKKALHAAAQKKWGKDESTWPTFKHPVFRDGNTKKFEGYKDKIVVLAKTKIKPGVVDKDVQEIIDPNEIYAGCWARASITAYAYDTKGNRGVAFTLNNIQKIKDDTAFSGRTRATDDFGAIEVDSDDFEVESENDSFGF